MGIIVDDPHGHGLRILKPRIDFLAWVAIGMSWSSSSSSLVLLLGLLGGMGLGVGVE